MSNGNEKLKESLKADIAKFEPDADITDAYLNSTIQKYKTPDNLYRSMYKLYLPDASAEEVEIFVSQKMEMLGFGTTEVSPLTKPTANGYITTTPTQVKPDEKISVPALPPDQEKEFKTWYSRYASTTGNSKDPDDPLHHYDYRGFWKEDKGKTVLKK